MRSSRKIFALLLVAAFVMGSAGCARKELTRQNFIAEIESYGIEKAINEQLFNIGGSEYDQYRWLVTELNSMA